MQTYIVRVERRDIDGFIDKFSVSVEACNDRAAAEYVVSEYSNVTIISVKAMV